MVDIVRDSYNSPPTPWTHLGQGEARANIEAAIPSIGRIELPDHPSIPYAGTGFVVGDGLTAALSRTLPHATAVVGLPSGNGYLFTLLPFALAVPDTLYGVTAQVAAIMGRSTAKKTPR